MSDIQAQYQDPQSPLFVTPVGRLIGGSVWDVNTKDWEGNPLTHKKGPNAGQPRSEYAFTLAIPKTDASFNLLYQKMVIEAKRGFPNYFDANYNYIGPDAPDGFSWKYIDGDSTRMNKKGKIPCQQPHYPGHWIFFFKGDSSIPPFCIDQQANPLTDKNSIKRGYWIRVMGSLKQNGVTGNPGLYINYKTVQLCGYGDEIVTGPDPKEQAAAAGSFVLPAGASATPLAPSTVPSAPGTAPVASMPMPPAPGQQIAPPAAPAAPATQVQSAPSFLTPPAPGGTPAPEAPAPAAPVGPSPDQKFNYQGGIYTRAALLQAGHTEQNIATYQPVA